MKAYLLDTSALVAHYFHEPCAETIVEMFSDSDNVMRICSLSLTELSVSLAVHDIGSVERRRVVDQYRGMMSEVVPVTAENATRAADIKDASKPRLPLVDAVIAACASGTNSTLVHCDAHYSGIPDRYVRQIRLP